MASAECTCDFTSGAVVGALAGWALGSFFPHSLYLGIAAAFSLRSLLEWFATLL